MLLLQQNMVVVRDYVKIVGSTILRTTLEKNKTFTCNKRLDTLAKVILQALDKIRLNHISVFVWTSKSPSVYPIENL